VLFQVIVDVDPATARLVDYVEKRPTDPETSKCPLIPIVIMKTESADPESLVAMESKTAWSKIIDIPCHSRDALYVIIELLYRRLRVEQTYDSLQRKHVLSSKYPFWDIFGGQKPAVSKHADMARHSTVTEGSNHIEETESALEHRLDEGDDWTETETLLPSFVLHARDEMPETYQRARPHKLNKHLLKGSEDFVEMGPPGLSSLEQGSDISSSTRFRYRVPTDYDSQEISPDLRLEARIGGLGGVRSNATAAANIGQYIK
jgi:hypothetical protein